MSFLQIVGAAGGAVAVYLLVGWLLSIRLADVSIVDVMWGPGFLLVASVGAVLGRGTPARQVLIVAMVALWGLRLAVHIFIRNHGKGEDYRYRAMRERQGRRFVWLSALTVFGLQGVLMLFIGLPLLAATTLPDRIRGALPGGLSLLDFVGLSVYGVGLFFETVGDLQLVKFKADPQNRGKVCDVGLWRYTRHPNYFGDATVWWGLYLVACSAPPGWSTFVSPIAMTVLLLKVSGVALLEKGLSSTKPGYAEYVARTSAFVPWFPRPLKTSKS
ncbi:MAG: DUF1295 domain-containing protein [Thermoanaerobaculia bacterium]